MGVVVVLEKGGVQPTIQNKSPDNKNKKQTITPHPPPFFLSYPLETDCNKHVQITTSM